jgi:cyclohexyl-isocyanide hydratase
VHELRLSAILAAFGVDVAKERVVTDRNRITAGGVTAGIDFALTLLARLRGEAVARTTQLAMEYDPAPPFDSGSSDRTAPELVAVARSAVAALNTRILAIAASQREHRVAHALQA